jgi:hypothetical protein
MCPTAERRIGLRRSRPCVFSQVVTTRRLAEPTRADCRSEGDAVLMQLHSRGLHSRELRCRGLRCTPTLSINGVVHRGGYDPPTLLAALAP